MKRMRKKDLIERCERAEDNVRVLNERFLDFKDLQEEIRVLKRIIVELNLRLGNNQKISPEILESDLGRNLIVMKEELSFDQILITIKDNNCIDNVLKMRNK